MHYFFYKYLLNTFYVPGNNLAVEDTALNETNIAPVPVKLDTVRMAVFEHWLWNCWDLNLGSIN